MAKKFSIRKLLFVGMLSVVGLFGANSVVINKQVEDSTSVKETNAADSDYLVVWFHVSCDWGYDREFYGGDDKGEQYYVYKIGSTSYNTKHYYGKDYRAKDNTYSEVYAAKLVKIYLPKNATEIQFSLYFWTPGSRDYVQYESVVGKNGMAYILDSHHTSQSNQIGHWETYDYMVNNYFKKVYFSLTNGWNGGASNLKNFWVWSQLSLKNATGSSPAMQTGRQHCCYPLYYRPSLITKNGYTYIEILTPYCDSAKTEVLVLETEFNSDTGRNKTANLEFNDWFNEYGEPAYFVTSNKTTGSDTQDGYWGCFGQNSELFLLGNGSFTKSNNPWKPKAGISLSPSSREGYEYELLNQHFEVNDVFQIKDFNENTWYYWDDIDTTDSDTGKLVQAVYNQITVGSEKWKSQGNFTTSFQNYSGINGGSGGSSMDYNNLYFKVPSWFYGNSMKRIKIRTYSDYGGHQYRQVWENEYIDTVDGYRIYCIENVDTRYGFEFGRSTNTTSDVSDLSDLDAITTWTSFEGNKNIAFKETGYYNIYINDEWELEIVPVEMDFTDGDVIYLDTNNMSNWDGKTPKVHVWSTIGGTPIDRDMSLVHGRDGTSDVFEWRVEKIGVNNPDRIIFYHDTLSEGNKTGDLYIGGTYTIGQNLFLLTSNTGGNWKITITGTERADYYGNYFDSLTDGDAGGVCDPEGSGAAYHNTLQTKWRLLATEYNSMCDDAQDIVTNSDGKREGEAGTTLEIAMGRYDYMIFHKHYTFVDSLSVDITDFANRGENPNKAYSSSVSNIGFSFIGSDSDYSFSTLIIIIASSISLLSITALSVLVIKKRKQKE